MMFPKKNKIILKGVKQKKLHEAVWRRDNCCCALCGQFIEAGVKAHHEPPRSHGGQDIEENLITLCNGCHYQRHFGAVREYKEKCENYLHEVYGHAV